MKVTKNTYIAVFTSMTLLLASSVLAKESPTPKYSAKEQPEKLKKLQAAWDHYAKYVGVVGLTWAF